MWFALKVEDIVVVKSNAQPTSLPEGADTVYMKLRGSKTNQAGPPTVGMLKRSGHPMLCPVAGSLLLNQARGSTAASLPAAVFAADDDAYSCITTTKPPQVSRRQPWS
ncbi:TPA: hypothetical protein N0F65_001144 [Lagenidium giganteum]|uniref:Uncharacterized protein n=1 Tax=Lagenidium giganteum TaxID=4803 RepID=A0AAV2YYI6_9STRA|nr:TPA: hypothetical protein N0F65_001144 [Lagenidium giganteum]